MKAWQAAMAAVAIIAAARPSLVQDMTAAEKAALDASWKARRAGRYLDAATVLRRVAFKPDGTPNDSFAYEQWREAWGLMTGEAPASAEPTRPLDAKLSAQLRMATLRDALPEIVSRAAKTRVVFLNEDHGSPRDRAFGLEVARALRPLGYDVIAVETLTNVADETAAATAMRQLAHDGYVHRETGTYTRDPVFADFLRQAMAIGYRPVAYEKTDFTPTSDIATQIAQREQAQADYLVGRALKPNPRSKILVYVGFSHATEAPLVRDGKPTRWLATRLKAMTGIDPLTVDQTSLGEHSSYVGPARFAAVDDRVKDRSMVLMHGQTPFAIDQFAGAVDLQVVHPHVAAVGGRPGWLLAMGRTPMAIPTDVLPTKGTRLVQAFVASEADDAVPVDQVLVTAGKPAPVLMLPSAKVRFAVQDAAD